MTWLKTDDKFPEHRKLRRLSDGAYRMHHTAMCSCAKDETDGRVTEADIEDMQHGDRLRKYVDSLVSAGLWDAIDGGWLIHDFLHYNPSHAVQDARRARDRTRQTAKRDRDGVTDSSVTPSGKGVSRGESETRPIGVTAPRPVPSRPEEIQPPTVVGPRKRGARLSAEFVPSEKARATILAECPRLDLRREHAKFADYYAAAPGQRGVKLDWDATWRNWMRKATEDAPRRSTSRQQETDDLFAAAGVRMGVTTNQLTEGESE